MYLRVHRIFFKNSKITVKSTVLSAFDASHATPQHSKASSEELQKLA